MMLVLAVLLLPACERAQPVAERPPTDVMQQAPLFQPARMTERRTSRETVETVFHSPVAADSIAAWYRHAFDARGWEIVGDMTGPDGSVTLHIARQGPPLWVIIRPSEAGSDFSLIGASPDTTSSEP
ncbi:MAG: hypothetical protein IH616_17590 [Gemmatimonadales bacterium]|jgi:hypothetical protein|nr:hypothetical protein [Gemmatimonadales bacterium]